MENLTVEQLIHQLQLSHRSHFTGSIDLQSAQGEAWSLYFHVGRLIWATGGSHRFRRWYRNLNQFCPDISPNGVRLREAGIHKTWEYLALTVLIKRQRIQREQAIAVIQSNITEVLFDILQGIDKVNRHTHVSEDTQSITEPLAMINAEQIFNRAQQVWELWCNADLAPHSPNLAPVLNRPDELQKQTSPSTYQTLTNLVNGTSTLRDVAVLMKQNPITIARSLLPYIRRGLIGLQEVPDLAPPETPAPSPVQAVSPVQNRPLIVCVDDSFQVCQTLQQIVNSAGYRFASIQDSMQALPALLELKPSLIFLDLMMPVANGYEICAQIRRVSALKETPVVILTGKDGLIDRVRAKMVGASDYLSKPVEAEKVLAVARKYVTVQVSSQEAEAAATQIVPASHASEGYEMGETTALLLKQSLSNV